jgi:hypothetical protein
MCLNHLTNFPLLFLISITFLLFMPHLGNSARVKTQTPIKSRWVVSLLLHDFALTPNIPNKRMKSMLSLYLKLKFSTKSVLQNAREVAKREKFGLPQVNVQYATRLKTEMDAQGHNVLLIERDASYVRPMLERVVLQEEIELQKMNKVNMTAKESRHSLNSGGRTMPCY